MHVQDKCDCGAVFDMDDEGEFNLSGTPVSQDKHFFWERMHAPHRREFAIKRCRDICLGMEIGAGAVDCAVAIETEYPDIFEWRKR